MAAQILRNFKFPKALAERFGERAQSIRDEYGIRGRWTVYGVVLTAAFCDPKNRAKVGKAIQDGAVDGVLYKIPDQLKTFFQASFETTQDRAVVVETIRVMQKTMSPLVVHQYHLISAAISLWLAGDITVEFSARVAKE